jgi:hypothetical protein
MKATTKGEVVRRTALVAVAVGVLAGIGATAALATTPATTVVDLSTCDREGGTTTVPAGNDVMVQLGTITSGTRGSVVNFLKKQQTMYGVAVNGGPSTITDISNDYSEPYQLPTGEWQVALPTIDLGVLAAGDTVLVGEETDFVGRVNFLFPPIGQTHFGPFKLGAGDSFGAECLITAV